MSSSNRMRVALRWVQLYNTPRSSMPRKIHLLIAPVLLLTTCRSRLAQIQWGQDGWTTASPRTAFPFVAGFEWDLDSDGDPEHVVHQNGRVSIPRQEFEIWNSPPEW